eukprot:27363_1
MKRLCFREFSRKFRPSRSVNQFRLAVRCWSSRESSPIANVSVNPEPVPYSHKDIAPFHEMTKQIHASSVMQHIDSKNPCMYVMYEQPCTEAIAKMQQNDIGCVLVVSAAGRIVGILSQRDILQKIASKGLDPSKTPIRSVMTANISYAFPSQTLEDCTVHMIREHLRHVPVVEFEADSRFSSFTQKHPSVLHLEGMITIKMVAKKLHELAVFDDDTQTASSALQSAGCDVSVPTVQKRSHASVRPTDSALRAVRMMQRYAARPAVVADEDGKILGILTERDYTMKAYRDPEKFDELLVKDIMTADPICVAENTSVKECMTVLMNNRFRHLPVVTDDKRCLGVLSIRDIVRSVYIADLA